MSINLPVKSIAAIARLMAIAMLAAALPAQAQSWTRAWTASMWRANDDQAIAVQNVTLRSAVRVGAAGDRIRIRLSNRVGPPVRIGAASVRRADGTTMRVTFGGAPQTLLASGKLLVSDPVALPVKPFEVVEISLFFPEAAQLRTVHGAAGQPTLLSPTGDHTTDGFAPAARNPLRPLITGVDVDTGAARPVIVAFGDSITDNVHCPNDAMPRCRWGDVLGRRLTDAGKPHVVITQAIGGNRILNQGTGPSALARFEHDVLSVPGVSHVVLLEGINDIGTSGPAPGRPDRATITPDQLIAGYRQLIALAHAKGIKVIGMTILPFRGAGYFSEDREAMRVTVNQWIRTSGAFDGVVDMEKVVADRAAPTRLDPALDPGDHLHPNGEGQTRMGNAIPLSLFD
jgi:lysophospholipase L1-like esterase